MDRALSRYGRQLLSLYPTDLQGDMSEALEDLMRDAVQLAREVADAEARGVSYADAARGTDFPLMAKVHHGAIDLLQTEFSADDRTAIEDIVEGTPDFDVDALRRSWFMVASDEDDGGALGGALMRYLLYQAVRLNVWVLTWEGGAGLEAAGALRELDDAAEAQLRQRLAMDEMQDPAVRPLQVLVADALEGLGHIWEGKQRELAKSRPEEVELVHGLTRAAEVARNLTSADAALIRNEIDGATGGKKLGSKELAERNSLALKSHNATDQRRRRLLAKLQDDPEPEPSGDRFIDLIE